MPANNEVVNVSKKQLSELAAVKLAVIGAFGTIITEDFTEEQYQHMDAIIDKLSGDIIRPSTKLSPDEAFNKVLDLLESVDNWFYSYHDLEQGD